MHRNKELMGAVDGVLTGLVIGGSNLYQLVTGDAQECSREAVNDTKNSSSFIESMIVPK
jgi:hypothetical protein